MAELTPMMRQYLQVKAAHPDCLLFFRLGDFYEMFLEDAKVGAEELGLTLTTRDRGKPEDERTPMCGVPYHSAQSYIARLIKRGYKVAICEQMEDPALAKGLVERDVIRIVTPGTAMDDVMLDESRNNYICAIYQDSTGAALARCDMSTGQFVVIPYAGADWLPHMLNQLSACPPSEAILSDAAASEAELAAFLRERLGCLCQEGGEARFRPEPALSALASCGLRPAEEPAVLSGRRRPGLLSGRDPKDRPEPPGAPGDGGGYRGAPHGAGPHRPADTGTHRDSSEQGEKRLSAVGAGPHPHPHGPPADPRLAGAAPLLGVRHPPPPGRGGRPGRNHRGPEISSTASRPPSGRSCP